MNKNKTIIYLLSTLIIIFVAILVYGVYEIKTKNQKISEQTNQADQAMNESVVAGSIRYIRNNSSQSVNKIETLVLTNDKLVPFIETIEKLGKDMNLTIKTTSVSLDKTDSSKETKYPTNVHLTIDTDGTWGSSLNFLHALEFLPTKVNIDSSSLSLGAAINNASLPVSGSQIKPSVGRVWHTSTTITVTLFK